VVGELPDLVAGKIPGREKPDENIVASLIGLGSIDLGISLRIYENARSRGLGQLVTFMTY
jgi:ornithine cyclodeaminase/alanine dehydrogenase-like protein (mu-crystallin family)